MSDPFLAHTLEQLANPVSVYSRTPNTGDAAAIDLGIGEAQYPLSAAVRAEIGAAVADLDKIWYDDPAGDAVLRAAYLRHLLRSGGHTSADIDQVLVTAGGKEAAWLAVRYLVLRVCSGGTVLVPQPGWEPYSLWLTAADCPQTRYAPTAVAENPDILRRIVAGATPRPTVLIINYPHNPTGVHVDQQQMNQIVAIATDLGLSVMSDEVYRAFAPGHVSAAHAPTFDPAQHLIVDSCSKWLAVAGLRVGFLIADRRTIHDLMLFRSSYASCTSKVSQHVATQLLTSPTAKSWLAEIRAQIEHTRRATAKCLADIGIQVSSEGGLYIWWRHPRPGQLPALDSHGYAKITEGAGFGSSQHIRLCPARAGLDPLAAAAAVVNTLRER